ESGDVRAQLLKVLWGFKRDDCDDVVLKGLEDAAWEARLTVAEIFGKSRLADRSVEFRKRAIEMLMKVLPVEVDGRTRNYIHGALIELTEKDFGTDVKAWKDWWAKSKERYGQAKEEKREGEEPREPGKIKTEVVPPWKDEKDEEEGKPKPRFFGEEISKKKVFFVIDVSGSMAEASSGGKTKLELVKKEMKSVIEAMDESYSFNMIFFNHGLVKWKDKLQKATKEVKAEAIAVIERQQPMGMTNIWASLKTALEDADTKLIVFLTDGLPTAGFTDTKRILEDVKKWNKYKDIQINTVGMQGADATFLGDLASQNKGIFRMVN
ncbi:MAG: VWA domain-containing protein, partial [Planctomycetota bacterium]|nr:VWA domain-containing protein [Planctomycetota bacterium]